jgi:hypothetical protein
MAKRRADSIDPRAEDSAADGELLGQVECEPVKQDFTSAEENPPPAAKVVQRPQLKMLSLDVPLTEPVGGYQAFNVQLRLHGSEREMMRQLRAGLQRIGAKIKHRSRELPVKTGADALRWLLQQLGGGDGK